MLVQRFNYHQFKHFVSHFFSAKRKGHGIHSPFVYQLCEEVFYNEHAFYDFEKLDTTRQELFKNKAEIEMDDLGAGSKVLKYKNRRINDIAKYGISPKRQSELIYLLINYLDCKTSIELGTSLGLNTLYMASAGKSGKIYTIEGSSQLSEFASRLALSDHYQNIQFIRGNFNAALPQLLESISSFDLLYVDGNHAYQATLDYFRMALKKKINSSVILFDDIYWSVGMTRAWEEIIQHKEVRLSIDCFYFGLIFFKEEIKEKQDIKLYL